ncbi:MAG: hypothetical protein JSS87_05335 [Acidobacteria bacterium]|nr:hypothetical protein [Acidobacteriota bacterium]
MTTLHKDGPSLIESGAPFQAERVTHMERALPDGIKTVRDVHETLARDFDGRVMDRSEVTSGAQNGPSPHRIFFTLIDPVTHIETSWDSVTMKGMQLHFKPEQSIMVRPSPQVQSSSVPHFTRDKVTVRKEDLGTRQIAGLIAKGTRMVTVIPVGLIGNDKEIEMRHDVWLADNFNIPLLDEEENPFSGLYRIEVTSLAQTAPDPALFKLPNGLKVRDFPLPGLSGSHSLTQLPPVR